MNGQLKICAVIPTYNNAGTLTGVLDGVFEHISEVIVVNDGSTDGTSALLSEYSRPLTAIEFPKNKGKGAALKAGLRKARELGFDYALTIDSDGQHFPSDIPAFIDAIEANPGALILGSRNLQAENMPSGSTFANRFSNFWFTVQTAKKLPDTQTGFRAYPLKNLPALSLLTRRYEAELELLVFSVWKGVKAVPVPVKVIYPEDRVTSFRPAADFTRISILNTILCVLAIVYGYPRMLINKLLCRTFVV